MPGGFFLTGRKESKDRSSQFGVGEALHHRVHLDGCLGHRLGAESSSPFESFDPAVEAGPGSFSGGGDLGSGAEAGDALEGDPVQRGVLEDEWPKHLDTDGYDVGDGVVGLGQLVDAVGQELEGALGEGVDEQPLLGAEQAVDRPRGGPDRLGHGPDGKGLDTTLGYEALGGDAKRGPGLVAVLPRPAHP